MSFLQERFREAPSLLSRRRERRTLRRTLPIIGVLLCVGIGLYQGLNTSLPMSIMYIGRAIAGLIFCGMLGLMIGVLVTTLIVVIYNFVLDGKVSLIDLDFIDEVPLLFVAFAGLVGVFWSSQWSELFGLVGWGFVLLIGFEVVMKRPEQKQPY